MNWRRGLRILKWSILILVLVLLGLIASVSSIVGTEPGSRWFLQQASRFLPLELGDIRGNLLTGLDLGYIEYRIEQDGQLAQRYRAEQVSFRWQPFALAYSAVSVQSLRAEKLLLVLPLPADDAQSQPSLWPGFALPVRMELGQLQLRDIRIEQQTLEGIPKPLVAFQSLGGSLSLGTFNFRVGDLALVADDYTLIANGRIGLRYPYDASLDLLWQYQLGNEEAGADPLLFSGRASLLGDIQKLNVDHQLTAPLHIQSRGHFLPNLSSPPEAIASLATPEVHLVSDWPLQPLLARWLPEGAPLPSLEGGLVVSGWLDAYQLQLNTRVETDEWPAFRVEAEADGDLQHLNINYLRSQLLGGDGPASHLELSGHFAWSPLLAWDITLAADNLDPGRLLPDWPGQVSLKGRSRGQYGEGQLSLHVEDLNANGELRGLDLNARGSLSLDNKVVESPGLVLSLGANRLDIKGELTGKEADLGWTLEAPFLQQLDTRLAGSLKTRGHLRGALENPRVDLTVEAQQIRWDQQLALAELSLALKPDEQQMYQLVLALKQLDIGGTRIDRFELTGNGDLPGHKLQALLDTANFGQLNLALNSGYDQGQWQGRLTELELRLPKLPRWWLLSASGMSLTGQTLDLGEICLTTRSRNPAPNADSTEGRDDVVSDGAEASDTGSVTPSLCTRARRDEGGLMVTGVLDSIPLRQLRSLLKPEVSLQGYLEGQFQFNQPQGQEPSADFRLVTRDAELHYQYADDPMQVFPWEISRLQGEWRNQQVRAEVESRWPPYGQLAAQASLNTANQQLMAKLDATFSDLTPLGALIPYVDELNGQLVADMEISGALQHPQLGGKIVLTQGAAKVPHLGLVLEGIDIGLTSHTDGRLALDSRFKSGEGNMQISGELQGLGSEQWQLLGAIEGDNFQVIDQQQIKARISPSIRLSASAEETRLTGTARIPYARADIKSLPPSATQVSEDVVIEEAGQTHEGGIQHRLFVNVTAELGDDVRFNGFGLTSRLEGRMLVVKTPERSLLTTGYVGVAEGKYKAYGQELTISRGQLVFQGPYDNPGLDIRAQRLLRGTSDHIVGLQIGGTLQRPTSQVYSNQPESSDGDAMGLLLIGKPLSEASAGDAYLIISAMSGLGMSEEGGVTSKIANAFSLDELTINAEDGLEQSALWLGKQITDRLYLRYVVSLFEQANKLVMTYQINDRLRLEAESGTTQSADIIYKIER